MSRRRLIQAGTVVAPALLGAQAARAAAGPERLREDTRPLPGFTFLDAEGKEKTAADFAGQGLVVNLWATWCAPCVAEMPALERLAAALAGERVAVLPLSSDRGGKSAVEGFYQRTGITGLGVWLDPRGAAARALGARGLPTTVVVDRTGQERARLEGDAAWDRPDMVAAVRRLVG
ncbi:TlpA disulfide reductase family protein [Roseococcus sp. SYP-B2431]|uniref:TlpA family protein disulfide reductase n=1 Tax=Roseococcus sp. SYP-B2431 TaxID=2496640 RepID=UPI001F0F0546|nr:TlpA disulfide reductase family protein [Roseococcus sp. SYP-B2431]